MSGSVDLSAALGGRGVVLLGCGKMGGAMLEGWLAAGVAPEQVLAIDPSPSPTVADWLMRSGIGLADGLGARTAAETAVVVVAVKPQMLDAALPGVAALGGGETLVLSVAAGAPIARFKDTFGAGTPVVRSMPNTPAAIGMGVSALVAGAGVDAAGRELAEALCAAVGQTLWLHNEADLDAVTGVSGSGPAYVFHLIEALAAAGVAEGLPEALAMRLARATVVGAGALAGASEKSAAQLRIDVTSPAGTTAAGLGQLMDPDSGLGPLMRRTVAAAAARSRELGG